MKRWKYDEVSRGCLKSLVMAMNGRGKFGWESTGWQQTETLVETSPGKVEPRKIYEAVMKREIPEPPEKVSEPQRFVDLADILIDLIKESRKLKRH